MCDNNGRPWGEIREDEKEGYLHERAVKLSTELRVPIYEIAEVLCESWGWDKKIIRKYEL